MFPHFQNYLNPQVRTIKLVNSVFLPPLSFKISLRDISFYISLNFLGFYLSKMLAEFSLICFFQRVWKKVLIFGVHTPRKSMNLCLFTHAPVSHSKLMVEFFENLFPQRQKGWAGGSHDLLYENSIRKYEDDLEQ